MQVKAKSTITYVLVYGRDNPQYIDGLTVLTLEQRNGRYVATCMFPRIYKDSLQAKLRAGAQLHVATGNGGDIVYDPHRIMLKVELVEDMPAPVLAGPRWPVMLRFEVEVREV